MIFVVGKSGFGMNCSMMFREVSLGLLIYVIYVLIILWRLCGVMFVVIFIVMSVDLFINRLG